MAKKTQKQKMLKDLKRKIEKANKRIDAMKKQGYGDLTVIKYGITQASKINKQKKADKFYLSKATSVKKMQQLAMALDKFIGSKWTTSKGRKEILDKRISYFTDMSKEYKLSKKETLYLFDLYETDIYHKAVEKGMMDSKQAIDLIKHNVDSRKALLTVEKELNKLIVDDSHNADDTIQKLKDAISGKK